MCCRFVRKLLAVAFLPVIAIRPAFIAFENHRLTQRNPAIRSLLDYYSATWLDGDYALVMWNVHGQATRTNNRVEGWHSRLNKAIGAPHPNTHQLVGGRSEGRAGGHRADGHTGPTRRCSRASTTTIQRPRRQTGPTATTLQTGTVDDRQVPVGTTPHRA